MFLPVGIFKFASLQHGRRFLELLSCRPHPHVSFLVDLDMDDVRAAAHGAILDVLLPRSRRQVDGQDNLLTAGIANVTGLVFHCLLHNYARAPSAATSIPRREAIPPRGTIKSTAPVAMADRGIP